MLSGQPADDTPTSGVVVPFSNPEHMTARAIVDELATMGTVLVGDPDAMPMDLTLRYPAPCGTVITVGFTQRVGLERELEHVRARERGIVNLRRLQAEMKGVGLSFGRDPRQGAPFLLLQGCRGEAIAPFERIQDLYMHVYEAVCARDARIDDMIDERRDAMFGRDAGPWGLDR